MKITTISNFRKDSKKYFDQVLHDRDILVITRTDGQAIVAMTLDAYNDLTKPESAKQSNAPNHERPPT